MFYDASRKFILSYFLNFIFLYLSVKIKFKAIILIFGTGIDIIEVDRVEKQISNNNGFKEDIFTKREIEYCESKKNKAQHFAARFAAKEAFFKALGTGWRDGMGFIEIEILNNELGKPEIELHGETKKFSEKQNISNIHVSLSHIKKIVTAIITLEK